MDASRSEVGLGGERQIVAHLLSATPGACFAADPGAIINFYVSLKCKPLLLLAGPSQSGKIALVQCLALALTGGNAWAVPVHARSCLVGRPEWQRRPVNRSPDTAEHQQDPGAD